MEFTITVNLDQLTGDQSNELGRILRYWAGALKGTDLTAGQGMNVYDSTYRKVGRWSVEQGNQSTSTPSDSEAPRATDDDQAPITAAPPPAPELPSTPGQPDEQVHDAEHDAAQVAAPSETPDLPQTPGQPDQA